MDLDVTDRVYLLSGASRGLGRATAEVLLAERARVVVSGRDPARLEKTVTELGAIAGTDRVAGVVADNADPGAPAALVGAALEHWSRVDGALISVGGPPAAGVLEVSDEAWERAFSSVFLGAVRMCREVSAALVDGGSIALVLSTSVRAPITGLGVSNGLRPGLAMVAKELADELGPRGIRVNGLLPGRVETERVQELDAMGGDPVGRKAQEVGKIPLRRYGRPEEFGRAAAFLLSPASSFVSGVMLPVDGGMTRAL